eukprot:6181255-Pleurochrysis_carterae.AAC.1
MLVSCVGTTLRVHSYPYADLEGDPSRAGPDAACQLFGAPAAILVTYVRAHTTKLLHARPYLPTCPPTYPRSSPPLCELRVPQRNYFMFTPMLAATCVGTVEYRSITEPIRSSNPLVGYLEG